MGGEFIVGYDPLVCVSKDRDVPDDVVQRDAEGFCATDTIIKCSQQDLLTIQDLGPIDTMEFVLLCLGAKVRDVRSKLRSGEPIALGTSYPEAAALYMGAQADVAVIRRGAVEGLPLRFPQIDAVFEIRRRGTSARENNLVEVATIAPICLARLTRKEQL